MPTVNELIADELVKFHKMAEDLNDTIDPLVALNGARNIMDILRLYEQISYIKEIADALTKMANKNLPTLAERANKMMEEDGIDKIAVGGKTYTPAMKTHVSVNKDDKPTIIDWLKQTPDGASMVREDFHPATFASYITKEFIDKGQVPPPEVKVFQQHTLSVRTSRS